MIEYHINDPKISNIYDKIYDNIRNASPGYRIELLREELYQYNCFFQWHDDRWWLCFENEQDAVAFLLLN
jgi:hypothetical protein